MLVVKKKNSRKKIILIAAAAALLVSAAGAATYYFLLRSPDTNNTASTDTGAEINYDPPTEQEQTETDQHKQSLSDTPKNPAITSGKKQVQPSLSSVDKNSLRAFVTGVFEEGGTCSVTLTRPGATISKTSTGFGNASYTQCEVIDLSGEAVAGHKWDIVISYNSATAEGKAETKGVPL